MERTYPCVLERHDIVGKRTKYTCPKCKISGTFTRYVYTQTGEYIHPEVGRCDRETNCGYHYPPREFFKDYPEAKKQSYNEVKTQSLPPKNISYIPFEKFEGSLKMYDKNNLIIFFTRFFGKETTESLISKYFIGTSKRWGGSTVFWQVDISGKVRTGKIMLYHPETGKRAKEAANRISWAHWVLDLSKFTLQQCLFGEHLLRAEETKPVAIVESEKTAIIASVYMPEYVWLATGGLSNMSREKFDVLKGRKVTLFPDLGGFGKWQEKAKEMNFEISDLLEREASEYARKQGFDIADYLLQFDYRDYRGEKSPKIVPSCDPIIEKMSKKNPALMTLIKTFDCQVLRTESN